jgi:hypothetical protein
MLYMLTFSVEEAVAVTVTKDSAARDTGDDSDMDIANMENFVPPTLIEDEDTTGSIVSKPDELAEVKLSSRLRKCPFHCLL